MVAGTAQKSNLNVKVDTDLKEEASFVLSQMGMTLSSAVNMLLAQIVNERRLPFTPSTSFESSVLAAAAEPSRVVLSSSEDVHHFIENL